MAGNKHWTTTDNGFYPSTARRRPGHGRVPNTWSYDSAQNPDFNNPLSNYYAWKQATHDGLTGKTFYIMTQAADYAGNVETHVSTRSFVFNNVPPTSGPSLPAPLEAYTNGQLATISGTASPATGTISGVAISLWGVEDVAWFNFGSGHFTNP